MKSRNEGRTEPARGVSKKFIPLLKLFPGRPCFAVISLLALIAYPLPGQNFGRPVLCEVTNTEGEGTSSTFTNLSVAKPQNLNWWVEARGETASAPGAEGHPSEDRTAPDTAATSADSAAVLLVRKPADFNRDIYYRNKLETSVESGYLPINIPFVFDFLINSPYTQWPLKYTLVPNIFSLRWHLDGIWGR